MKKTFDNFYTSGRKFSLSEIDLKNRYQVINISILLSTLILIYGIIGNYLRHIEGLIPIEAIIIIINILMSIVLKKSKKAFEYVATIMTVQYTFLFLVILYVGDPADVKHAWFFTYSTILLYFQGSKKGLYWFIFFISMLLVAPLQRFVPIKYSFYEVSYLSFVLIIIYFITYFYRVKMDEANTLIKEQENKLIESENILKKELHHRVKNNMQLIISLFKLKLVPFMNPDIQRVIKEVTFKVQGMASVHNILYKQKIITNIDTREYFTALVNALKNGYDTEHIKFNMKIDTQLSNDQLIYCGLIVNEIVINALKYAFEDKKNGQGECNISLNLYNNNKQTILEIFDNGKGMDASRKNSFGSEMIESLIEHELKGKMKLETDKGVKYTFYIPR